MTTTTPTPPLTLGEAYAQAHSLLAWLARRRYRVPRQEVNDFVQDAAVLFVRYFPTFDGNTAHVGVFAGFMARNAAGKRKDRLSREARLKRLAAKEAERADADVTYDPEPDLDPLPDPAEELGRMRAAVDTLPPQFRDALMRYYGLDGRPRETLKQIGDREGIGREAVRQRLARAVGLAQAAVRAVSRG